MSLTIACVFDRDGLSKFDADSLAESVDILILPELFDGGYERLQNGGTSSQETKALLQEFAGISRKHHLGMIAGSLALPGRDGAVRNTAVVFADGEEIARYTKTHLFKPLGDDQYFAPGQPGEIVTLRCRDTSVRLAVIICYDLRFPEIVRPWFKSGLDLLVVPARWPAARDELWQALLKARAIENQCFVVGVDSRDGEGGGSYAYGPAGESIFALAPKGSDEERPWCSFTLELDDIASVKTRLDTRPDAILL